MAERESFEGLLANLRRQAPAPQGATPDHGQQQSQNNNSHAIFPPPLHDQQQQQYHHDSAGSSPIFQHHPSDMPSSGESPYFSEFNPSGQQSAQHFLQGPSQTLPQPVIPPYSSPMSPSVEGTNATRTASLLQLLKFSQAVPPASGTAQPSSPAATSTPPPAPATANVSLPQNPQRLHKRTISASDLVASILGRSSPEDSRASPQQQQQQAQPQTQQQENIAPPVDSTPQPASDPAVARQQTPVNPQDLVLQLLGRPKPAQAEHSIAPGEEPGVDNISHSPVPGEETQDPPVAKTGSSESRSVSVPPIASGETSRPPPPVKSQSMHFTPPPASKGLFTYVNPFDQLHATSPRNRAPRVSTPIPSSGRKSSGLGMAEFRAENVPLPYSPGATTHPLAFVEAEASKDSATLEEVVEKEQKLDQDYTEVNSPESQQNSNQEATAHSAEEHAFDPSLNNASNDISAGSNGEPNNGYGEAPASVAALGEPREDGYVTESMSDSNEPSPPIKVYNFPMKPFSAITIVKSDIKHPKYPGKKISDIARMPRSFDQLDRNLIAASPMYIVYAISKSNGRGGIRVLRQYDGKDRVLMKDSTDRTFNVTIGRGERILGTGISGAVLWADVSGDFDGPDWNSQMFVFPPSEEQGQSNGLLKSRARKTSRQVDVFAIGRGKTISIIHAPTAKAYVEGRKGNEVASKKYLADHARTIDTGKASKDFAFSDDDTVIVSIDKAGKLKLWDVEQLINFSNDLVYNQDYSPPPPPQKLTLLSTPSTVFSAVAAGESYRATSVMFLDKFRPYAKCLALRYVIVGMKQNHTLQLWDLALGRPVQEINFPQESDTDALCSVAYHPLTGIIVVGNPTRNSIYFIHLSAPKYNLPIMSQANYIRALAVRDPSIPKPDATAILSGLREYSFSSKGQLMSLDILDSTDTDGQGVPNKVLFELYVAHSRGMTTLSVFKEDLGWDSENRVQDSVDGIKEGLCTLSAMPPPPSAENLEKEKEKEKEKDGGVESTDILLPPKGSKPAPENAGTKAPVKSRSVSPTACLSDKGEIIEEKPAAVVTNGNKKERRRKDKPSSNTPVPAPSIHTPTEEDIKVEKSAPKPKANGAAHGAEPDVVTGVTSAVLEREIKKIEKTVSAEFTKVIGREMETLYRRINEDKRIQEAAGNAKQDAVLRLLSSTLTENVESVISRIVMNNIQGTVLPAIADVTAIALDRRLGDVLGKALNVSLPVELRAVVPEVVKKTMSHPDMLSRISESLTKPLAQTVEREFARTLQSSIIPAFKQLAQETAQKVSIEAEKKQNDTIAAMERLHNQDSKKIDQLMGVVKALSEQVTTMSRAQQEFQEQVQRAQAEYVQAYEETAEEVPPAATVSPQSNPQAPVPTPEQLEAQEVEQLLRSGKYEEGTIKWLQSKDRQAELFDELMVRYRYDFLPNLSQLVLLSVSAAVSVRFEHKVMERLSWLEGVLAVLDPMDNEIHEICHRIMVVVVQRLEQLYMRTAETNINDPILRRIPSIARRARELSSMAAEGFA